jgi:predicted dehydrogenase
MTNEKKLNRREFIIMSSLGATALGMGMKGEGATVDGVRWKKTKTSPNNAITVGMIAVGARAHDLMESIKRIEGTEIVAVCDAYKGRVERAIERTDGRAKEYTNYKEIISNPNIDAVVISTPDHLHRQQIIDALNARKHIYIEKPMTYSIEEGVQIINAAKNNKVAFQVGSQGVSSVLSHKAKEIVASGRLGQVTMVRAYYNRNTASGAWIYPIPPDASPKTVNWEMFLGDAPKHNFSLERFFRWRCYKDYSGGIATDLFVHLCNTIHYIMGAKMCSSVMAMGGLYRWRKSRDVPDTLNASLEYPEGFMVSISSTFNNQKLGGSGIQFMGTEGSLELAGGQLIFTPEVVYEDNGWIVNSWPSELEEAYYEDPNIREEEMPWTRNPEVIPDAETYRAEGIDDTTLHMAEFFDAIRNGTPTKEDATVGHHAASCAHLINLSIEKKKIIHWDAKGDTAKA